MIAYERANISTNKFAYSGYLIGIDSFGPKHWFVSLFFIILCCLNSNNNSNNKFSYSFF